MYRVFYCAKLRYTPTKYLLKTWLPKAVIAQAISENWLDSLIYFVWLKVKYKKPVFYNFSLRRVSAPLQCSPTTIKHHVDILVSKGLAWRTGKDLRLKSNNQLRREDRFIIPVGICNNKPGQRALLRWALTSNNLHHQHKTLTTKNNALRFHKQDIHGIKDYKICKKAAKKYPNRSSIESSLQNVLTLSNKSFGRIANRSKATGIKIQKSFNKLNLIQSFKRIMGIDMPILTRRQFYACGFEVGTFLTPSGLVCKRLSNGIYIRSEIV